MQRKIFMVFGLRTQKRQKAWSAQIEGTKISQTLSLSVTKISQTLQLTFMDIIPVENKKIAPSIHLGHLSSKGQENGYEWTA